MLSEVVLHAGFSCALSRVLVLVTHVARRRYPNVPPPLRHSSVTPLNTGTEETPMSTSSSLFRSCYKLGSLVTAAFYALVGILPTPMSANANPLFN